MSEILTEEEREAVDDIVGDVWPWSEVRPIIDRLELRVKAADAAERTAFDCIRDLTAERDKAQSLCETLESGAVIAVMTMAERDALAARVERLRAAIREDLRWHDGDGCLVETTVVAALQAAYQEEAKP